MLRYEVPVDGPWTVLELHPGPIVHVACREDPMVVEFWQLADQDRPRVERAFIVYGTGDPVAPAAEHYVGTATVAERQMVWHLFEHMRVGAAARQEVDR